MSKEIKRDNNIISIVKKEIENNSEYVEFDSGEGEIRINVEQFDLIAENILEAIKKIL